MDRDVTRADRPTPPRTPQREDASLRRLRWRARRGLLENDLLLGRFLQRQAGALDPAQADALAQLLDLSDPELLDLLLGRRQPDGELNRPAVRDLLLHVAGGPPPGGGSNP